MKKNKKTFKMPGGEILELPSGEVIRIVSLNPFVIRRGNFKPRPSKVFLKWVGDLKTRCPICAKSKTRTDVFLYGKKVGTLCGIKKHITTLNRSKKK